MAAIHASDFRKLPAAIERIVTVLLFQRYSPAIRQAPEDRARRLQHRIEVEHGDGAEANLNKLPEDEDARIALKVIPDLLDEQEEAIAS